MCGRESVPGVVVQGYRLASNVDGTSPFGKGTIELQAPLFQARGIDLSGSYLATLNVSIHPHEWAMRLREPTVTGVSWHADYPPENFFFSRCGVAVGSEICEGWIYHPDPSTKQAHPHDASVLEIIAPMIPNIRYGDEVVIWVDPREIRIE